MSIEMEVRKLLEEHGYVPKSTKKGSAWTFENSKYNCSVVNYHNNDTVAFNYLAKYMRDNVKRNYEDIVRKNRDEQEQLCHKVLSNLPFYKIIKDTITFKWSASKGIDFFSFSSRVGLDVFREIIQFIDIDSRSATLPSPRQIVEEYLPDWLYVKTVIDLHEDEAPTIDEILDEIEDKARRENKALKKNWREITRRNIPPWLATQPG